MIRDTKAKFAEGAWLTVLLIPGLLLIMGAVRRHYHRVFLETRSVAPLDLNDALLRYQSILPAQKTAALILDI